MKYTVDFLSNSWTLTIICVIVLIFLVLFIGNKIDKSKKTLYAKILALIMLGFYITNHAILIAIGEWELSKELPFHLCTISGLICCFIMFIPEKIDSFYLSFYFTVVSLEEYRQY